MSDAVILSPTEDTTEEAQLRAALQQSDNEVATEQATVAEPKPPTEKAEKSESPTDEAKVEKPDSSEPVAERTDGRDELGRFTAKAEAKVEKEPVKPLTEGQPEVVAQPAPPDKEQERTARAWQKIQAEKLEVRSTLAEVRQLKQQLEQQAQRPLAQPQAQFDSKRLYLAADEFERQGNDLIGQGDVETAQQKLKLARETRQYAQQTAQQEQYEAQKTQASNFEREWASHTDAAIRQYPALADPSTEEAQAMMELLEDYPILGYIPDGFKKGVEILQMRRDAATASGLRADNEKLKAEIKELREKTAISGGGVTTQIGAKDFDSMTLAEQEAWLIRDARQTDFARNS